ncbi:hypothetical protein FACS189443_0090 [Planctomycetales bacterium]|jgi:hypothetical protein|nr:hypothetical protein FACS189443_0090 [Planctomycetales bacterium]
MDPLISSIIQQKQDQTALQVQMSVLKKNMDVQKQIGELVVGLIQGSTMQTPGKTVGLGNQFDAFA